MLHCVMNVRFLDASTEHATAVAPGIFFYYVRRLPSIQALLRVRQEIDHAGKQRLLVYFQVMAPREVRALDLANEVHLAWVKLAEAAKRNADFGAIVVVQDGFAGAAIRAAVSTVLHVSRGSKPAKVFSAIEPAASWLEGALAGRPGAMSAADIIAAAHAVRARVEES